MFRNAASIVGVGWSDYSRASGRMVEALADEAARRAIDDAGLSPADIDGVITYAIGDSVPTSVVATNLGLPVLRHYADYSAGGNMACGSVLHAAMAVATGQAEAVLVYRALNGSSGIRYGGKAFSDLLERSGIHSDSEAQFLDTCGITMPAQHFALLCQRHMAKYGTTHDHLAAIAMLCRDNAASNDRAMKREPMSRADYDASKWIAEPFRVFDCCLQSDGACAVVVTSTERARELRHRPAAIRAGVTAAGPRNRGGMWGNLWADHAESHGRYSAERLFAQAGISPSDIDVAQIYDCFTFSVIAQIEDFGFCAKGEGGPFIASGMCDAGSSMPINTAGGMLSEAYLHGLNLVVENVLQLRGASTRQAQDPQFALATAGGAGTTGSAIILEAL